MADTQELDKWVKQAKEAIDQLAAIASTREAETLVLKKQLSSMPSKDSLKKQLLEELLKQ